MKVSIIIPVYNAEKYLEECINSAMNQTYPDIEIIVVDDGSTDRSPEILKKYTNKIKIITKKQGGVASARNAGIKIATGDWIKLLDNDDVLYPNAVEDLIKEARNLDKAKTLLYGNAVNIDSDGNIIGDRIEQNYNDLETFDFNVRLLDNNVAGIPSTWLFHKSVMKKCGMFDEVTLFDDFEYNLRCCLLHSCRLHLVQKKIAKYRVHANQLSWERLRKLSTLEKVINSVLDKLEATQREKYLTALKQYQRNKSIVEKIENFLAETAFMNLFPPSIAFWIRKVYGRFRRPQFKNEIET